MFTIGSVTASIAISAANWQMSEIVSQRITSTVTMEETSAQIVGKTITQSLTTIGKKTLIEDDAAV
jgi:hypothetical protein